MTPSRTIRTVTRSFSVAFVGCNRWLRAGLLAYWLTTMYVYNHLPRCAVLQLRFFFRVPILAKPTPIDAPLCSRKRRD